MAPNLPVTYIALFLVSMRTTDAIRTYNLDDDCWTLNNTVLYVLGATKGAAIFLKGGNDFSHQFQCNVAISTENQNHGIYVSLEVKKDEFRENKNCASYLQIGNEIFCNETRRIYTLLKGSRFMFLYHKNDSALIISIYAKINTENNLDVTTPAPSDDNGLRMPSIIGTAVALTLFVLCVTGWLIYSNRRSIEVEQNGSEEADDSASLLLDADDHRSEEVESDDSTSSHLLTDDVPTSENTRNFY